MIKKISLLLLLFSIFGLSLTKADFIDDAFWAQNPSDNEIENTLFSTDSSYTDNRT
jgi:hypothetical protein